MYSKVFVVLALVAAAHSHDLIRGNNDTEARVAFEEHLEAGPAIWQQTKDLFINASEHEVISQVNITDLRPDKDGYAQITAGGVGEKNVTITLKSPTILRGYDFLVSVSVCNQNETVHENNGTHENKSRPQIPRHVGIQNPQVPEEKISTKIPSDATTGKADLFTESGPTAVTGKPSEVRTEPTEVTDSTPTVQEVTVSPKTKDLSEPDVPETLEDLLEEKEQKKLQPSFGLYQLPRSTTTPRH